MKLNTLKDNIGATHNTKRLGRGIGSGKGKTSGRGVKGQKARVGGSSIKNFEGGQNPIYRRLPKRGFNPADMRPIATITLRSLEQAVQSGLIKKDQLIDLDLLQQLDLAPNTARRLKVIGNTAIKSTLKLKLNFVSEGAKAIIAKVGGVIEVIPAPVYTRK